MKPLEIWREGLFGMIEEFADSDKLRSCWSGEVPCVARSFVEDTCMLYDDFELNEFIDLGAANTNLTDEQFDALKAFRDRFDVLLESLGLGGAVWKSHQDVLDDPHWPKVVDAAIRFVQMRDGARH